MQIVIAGISSKATQLLTSLFFKIAINAHVSNAAQSAVRTIHITTSLNDRLYSRT